MPCLKNDTSSLGCKKYSQFPRNETSLPGNLWWKCFEQEHFYTRNYYVFFYLRSHIWKKMDEQFILCEKLLLAIRRKAKKSSFCSRKMKSAAAAAEIIITRKIETANKTWTKCTGKKAESKLEFYGIGIILLPLKNYLCILTAMHTQV